MASYLGRHRPEHSQTRRGPRAHWLLLLLAMAFFLAELGLGGLVRNTGADGLGRRDSQSTVDGREGRAPKELRGAGPVLRLGSDGRVTSRSMPAGTVALTFDDGPDPMWTPKVLDLLARHNAKATFFVIGSKVNEHPDLTRRILAEGHEVGVHTFTHADLAQTAPWWRRLELALSQNAIAAATGRLPTLMRPPFSSHPETLSGADYEALTDVAAGGYLIVLADRDTEDWQRPGVDAIVKQATPEPGQGAVVLMHDSGGDRSQTVAALEKLVPELAERGYRFRTVSEALGLPAGQPAPPGVRLRGEVLRWAQWLSGQLHTIMMGLLGVALCLAVLRTVLQVVTARMHVRRVRRRRLRPLTYLGPVTVIVPAYNESANIAATVRSLVDNDYPHISVVVVDDGSTDDTYDIVRRLNLPGVRVIRQANAGKPAALNTGLAHTHTDLVILADGDTVFEPDAVGRLLQPFVDPDVGAVSGNTKVANRRNLLGRWQHLEYVMGFNLDRRMFEVGECMPTVPGAIGAFRRTALADVGGVSAATLAEDTDLTMAVIRAGWRVVYEESAIAWTEAPATLRQLWRQRYRWCYGTMQAMWKHRRALVEMGPAGRLGRRGLTYLLVFQILLPLAAPAVDIYALYGLIFRPTSQPVSQVIGVWLGLLALQALTAAYALRLDGEPLGALWVLPLQQVVYRQLMYLVVVQSVATALAGIRLPWHRIVRTGAAQAVLRG